jgi:hypothetical protein
MVKDVQRHRRNCLHISPAWRYSIYKKYRYYIGLALTRNAKQLKQA